MTFTVLAAFCLLILNSPREMYGKNSAHAQWVFSYQQLLCQTTSNPIFKGL